MIDWTHNIENIATKLNPGNCPNCNSENTDYKYTLIKSDWGCCDIWCNDCKHAVHISRIKIEGNTSNKAIPNDLIY